MVIEDKIIELCLMFTDRKLTPLEAYCYLYQQGEFSCDEVASRLGWSVSEVSEFADRLVKIKVAEYLGDRYRIKGKKVKKQRVHSEKGMSLAKSLEMMLQQITGDFRAKDIVGWAIDFDTILKHHDLTEVIDVMRFAMTDDFWRKVIVSPKALYKHYTKIKIKMKHAKAGKITESNIREDLSELRR